MSMIKLASEIAKREGKKKEVSIGNIREVLSILTDMEAEGVKIGENKPASPLNVLMNAAKRKRKLRST